MSRPVGREEWADVAKGICILLVVLWHVVVKDYLRVDWHIDAPVPGVYGALGETLLPLRMPVFFTISGLLAVGATRRTWAATARGRIWRFAYLYVLWFAIHTAVFSLVPNFDTLSPHGPADVLEQLTISPTNLWYLLALVVYFVIGKATLRLPTAMVLVPAALVSAIASAGWIPSSGNRWQLLQNLVFFLAGLRLGPWVLRLARTATPRATLVGAAGYLAATGVVARSGAGTWFGVWPLLSAGAVAVAVAGAAQLVHVPRLGPGLAALGRRTLPVYVMHLPLLALWHLMLAGVWSSAGPRVQLGLAVALPVGTTAVVVGICLVLHRLLLRAGGQWLFDLPARRLARQGT